MPVNLEENNRLARGEVTVFQPALYYMAGFLLAGSPLLRTWRAGVLVDFSDIICPFTFGISGTRPLRRLITQLS